MNLYLTAEVLELLEKPLFENEDHREDGDLMLETHFIGVTNVYIRQSDMTGVLIVGPLP